MACGACTVGNVRLLTASAKGDPDEVECLGGESVVGLDGVVPCKVSGVTGHVFEDPRASVSAVGAGDGVAVAGEISLRESPCEVSEVPDFEVASSSDNNVVDVTCEIHVDTSAVTDDPDIVTSKFGSAVYA